MTRVESFNALVRGLVTIGLTGAYVYMAVMGRISPEAYTGTLGGVLTWWFLSRDRKSEQETTPSVPAPAAPVEVKP